jgi:2-polyprenyl-3-methyl-5-hydroxy-6-metoxy-1,4-benzoquinol methylase
MRSLVEARAIASETGGFSHAAIYRMVRSVLTAADCRGTLLDVGCGRGRLHDELIDVFDRYVGVDIVAFAGTPLEIRRVFADLDRRLPFLDGVADVTAAVETIEHLENPRAFVRELARVTRPGGLVLLTTPNQLSALSLLTLVVKRRFQAFQDVHYPAHLTALLEVDLRRIAAEAGLAEAAVYFSEHSRVPLTALTYPRWLARRFPSLLSDNLLIVARKPTLSTR